MVTEPQSAGASGSILINMGKRPQKKVFALPRSYEDELARFALRQARKAGGTQRIYRRGATLFCAFLAERCGAPRIEDVDAEHARSYQWFLSGDSGYARSTVTSLLISARLFCKGLVDGDVLDADPFGPLDRLPPPPAPDVRILTAPEAQAMVDATKRDRSVWGTRDLAMICVLYSGGLRQQELLALHREDIDWSRCTVTVRRGKGGAPRTVGLDRNAMATLEKYDRKRSVYLRALPVARRHKLADGPFWLSRKGGGLAATGLRGALKRRARDAGVDANVYPHALRHAAATHDAEAGLGDMELRDKYGWTPNSAMPWRYTRQSLRERTIERSQRLGASAALRL